MERPQAQKTWGRCPCGASIEGRFRGRSANEGNVEGEPKTGSGGGGNLEILREDRARIDEWEGARGLVPPKSIWRVFERFRFDRIEDFSAVSAEAFFEN